MSILYSKSTLPIATLVNAATVIAGSLVGLGVQHFFTDNIDTIVFQAVGLGTILIGMKMTFRLPDGYMLYFIFSLILGGILGEVMHIDQFMSGLSENLKSWMDIEDRRFSEGLLTAFLLFCIGSMTFVGAIEEGMTGNRELLLVKSVLDGFTSIALAASLGIGVLFSVIPLLVFQGGLTLVARKTKSFFRQETIDLMSSVGGILIIGIAINMLKLGHIRLENLLPALLMAIVLGTLAKILRDKKLPLK